MLLTEGEARQKWCPHVSLCEAGGAIYDNRGQSHGFTCCIASECMSWRWESKDSFAEKCGAWAGDNQPIEQDGPGPSGAKQSQREGYCGLAGKVE